MNGARTDLRASGECELAAWILCEPGVAAALERYEKRAEDSGARRQLLGTALRLTREMAPDVHEIVESCRARLGLELPLETYVYPEQQYNAAAVRPERGRRFVIGHEFGHPRFEHHKIPVGALLGAGVGEPGLRLRRFAWQRCAEISSDRAGLLCAGGLEPAARSLFKLASGLRGSRVRVRIDLFLAQVGDLREESERLAKAKEPVRSDWFAMHPFSPLRLRAVGLCARSGLIAPGGLPCPRLEAEVDELIRLGDPSYLQERSQAAEAMRRLLFAGAVRIGGAGGGRSQEALGALERLLGPGSVPWKLDTAALRRDLGQRVERVKELVPPLRRAQVIRDLCVIARADRMLSEPERRILFEIADSLGVDRAPVACTLGEALDAHVPARPGAASSVAAGASRSGERPLKPRRIPPFR